MRAASLVLVLIFAKLLAIGDREIAWSLSTVAAYVWQDVAVGVAFWLLDWLAGRRGIVASRVLWILYGAIVVLAAIDVPVTRALSSPLTVPMLRAAGAPLLGFVRPLPDGIQHHRDRAGDRGRRGVAAGDWRAAVERASGWRRARCRPCGGRRGNWQRGADVRIAPERRDCARGHGVSTHRVARRGSRLARAVVRAASRRRSDDAARDCSRSQRHSRRARVDSGPGAGELWRGS